MPPSMSKSLKKLQASETSKPRLSKYSLTAGVSNFAWRPALFFSRRSVSGAVCDLFVCPFSCFLFVCCFLVLSFFVLEGGGCQSWCSNLSCFVKPHKKGNIRYHKGVSFSWGIQIGDVFGFPLTMRRLHHLFPACKQPWKSKVNLLGP